MIPSLLRLLFIPAAVFSVSTAGLYAQSYYTVHQIDEAKAEAHSKHLPIAWLSSLTQYLTPRYANEKTGSDAELTNLALNTLQGQSVVIFQNGDGDLPSDPPIAAQEIEAMDEGVIAGGYHYTVPKILYFDPDMTQCLGRTIAPEVREGRDTSITSALLRLRHNPGAEALINGTAEASPGTAPTMSTNKSADDSLTTSMLGDYAPYLPYIAGAVVFLIIMMGYLAWRGRPTANPPRPF